MTLHQSVATPASVGVRTVPGPAGFRAADRDEWIGQLSLGIEQKNGRSYAARQYHHGALRVIRPHYLDDTGQVCYTIVNSGGGYLGADQYLLDFEVGDNASMVLTTQSAQKVYRTPQGPAVQHMSVKLGENAVLEYLPDQLIVYRQGSYLQYALFEMHPSASLVTSEVITPGWSPQATDFGYDLISLRAEVRVLTDDGPRRLMVDNIRLAPDAEDSITGVGMMEGHTHTGQLVIADARLDTEVYDEILKVVDASDTHTGLSWSSDASGARTAGVKGLCVRSLAHSTEAITNLHFAIVNLLRTTWRDQRPLFLRKNW